MSGVAIERHGRLAVLRLDKPRGNAIDEPLVEALARAASEVAANDGVRGVLPRLRAPEALLPGPRPRRPAEYDRASMERFMGSSAVAVWGSTASRSRWSRLSGAAVAESASSPSPATTVC
jgi:hypothetical protein